MHSSDIRNTQWLRYLYSLVPLQTPLSISICYTLKHWQETEDETMAYVSRSEWFQHALTGYMVHHESIFITKGG